MSTNSGSSAFPGAGAGPTDTGTNSEAALAPAVRGAGIEPRNARVVGYLVGAMVGGAAGLLWLEPPAQGWSRSTLHLGESSVAVRSVEIRYVPAWQRDALEDFDCVVFSDGRCAWRPRGPDVRLMVLGSESDGLPAAQAEALLAVLGNLSVGRGLELSRVRLDPGSDPRLNAELPRAAFELRALLERKGLLD